MAHATAQEQATRIEKDTMGEMEVPASAYWGASTQRAVLNFPVSDLRYPPAFISALGRIKRAAARTNAGLGLLDSAVADAVAAAAAEVVAGEVGRALSSSTSSRRGPAPRRTRTPTRSSRAAPAKSPRP